MLQSRGGEEDSSREDKDEGQRYLTDGSSAQRHGSVRKKCSVTVLLKQGPKPSGALSRPAGHLCPLP